MCEFHDSNGKGLGDNWWTDKFINFSIIDVYVLDVRSLAVSSRPRQSEME